VTQATQIADDLALTSALAHSIRAWSREKLAFASSVANEELQANVDLAAGYC
jgi:hypothetical protein